jgi:hypothetical protein
MSKTTINPKELSISSEQMDIVHKYFWNIPTIQMCRNMIRQHLFCNGIDYKGKSGANAANFSQHIMEDFWLPFCEDALDSIITYGFVVWRTRKIGDTVVPIVCLKDTYRLTIVENDGVIEYKVYDKSEKNNEILKGAYVYDEFGYRPEVNGNLMSMLHTLMPDIQYYFTMLNCMVQLEKKRVRPPILTQLQARGGGGNTGENEGIDYDFYADADIADAEEESKYKRNRQAVEALKHQQKLYDEFFDMNVDEDNFDAPSILDQMVPIPSGQTIASYPLQQGRNDLPNILKQLQDTICGVLGVPKSMIMSDTPHKSDAVGTHQMFQTTIVWWKRQMSEMCQMIYNIINAKELSNQVGDKLANRSSEADSKDIYLMTKKMSSRITFPTTPFTTNEELYNLYTQGVIEWKTYCTYISRNTSIPMDVIPPEPFTKKEKKQVLGIAKEAPRENSVIRNGEEPERTSSPMEEKEKNAENKIKKEEEKLEEKAKINDVKKAVGKKTEDPKGSKGSTEKIPKKAEEDKKNKKSPPQKKEGNVVKKNNKDDKNNNKDDKKNNKDDKKNNKDDKKNNKDDKKNNKDDKKNNKDDKKNNKDDKKRKADSISDEDKNKKKKKESKKKKSK